MCRSAVRRLVFKATRMPLTKMVEANEHFAKQHRRSAQTRQTRRRMHGVAKYPTSPPPLVKWNGTARTAQTWTLSIPAP